MINISDEKIRQELIRQFLNAETTLEEEHLLADFLSNTNIALSAEEEDILLMLQVSNFIERPEISEEKAIEFDHLMQIEHKKSTIVTMRWIVSAAVAVICTVFFLTFHHTDKAVEQPEVTMVIPDGSNITSMQESRSITTSELLETINILSDVGTGNMTITASSCDDGFIIKTTNSNGQPNSYILKRCSDGTSIELISQLTNF